MSLVIAPDVQPLLMAWLRAQPELSSLVGNRIHSTLPPTKVFPLIRIVRYAGGPIPGHEGTLHDPTMQIDCYGSANNEPQANDIGNKVVALLEQRFIGTITAGAFAATITNVRIFSQRTNWDSAQTNIDSAQTNIPVSRIQTRIHARPVL